MKQPLITREFLVEEYEIKGQTIVAIAKKLGVAKSTIQRYIKIYDISFLQKRKNKGVSYLPRKKGNESVNDVIQAWEWEDYKPEKPKITDERIERAIIDAKIDRKRLGN